METKLTFVDMGNLFMIDKIIRKDIELNHGIDNTIDITQPDTVRQMLPDIKNALKRTKLTFLATTNRLQALILCELKYCYSMKSQRYCRYDSFDNAIINTSSFSIQALELLKNATQNCLDLYTEMTQLKPESVNKAKYTTDDFINGIPAEDGRYILPMVFDSNGEITLDGDKIFELVATLIHSGVFTDKCILRFIDDLPLFIREVLYTIIKTPSLINEYSNLADAKYVEYDIRDLPKETDSIILKGQRREHVFVETPFADLMRKSGAGALMCTNGDSDAIHIFASKSDQTFKNITQRVAYGTRHISICFHATLTLHQKMSIACYNQLVRHVHQSCTRAKFNIENSVIPHKFVIPPSIEANADYIERYKKCLNDLYDTIYTVYQMGPILSVNWNTFVAELIQFLPMGHELVVITSTNLINEFHKGTKRLCNKAQWEIGNLTRETFDIIGELIGKDNEILKLAAPPCIFGTCTEGKGCCGDNSNIKPLFGK